MPDEANRPDLTILQEALKSISQLSTRFDQPLQPVRVDAQKIAAEKIPEGLNLDQPIEIDEEEILMVQ